jgi:hypothetical protein
MIEGAGTAGGPVEVSSGVWALCMDIADRWPAPSAFAQIEIPQGRWQICSLVVDPSCRSLYHLVGVKVRGLNQVLGWVGWDTLATAEFWQGAGFVLRGGDQVELTLRRSSSERTADFKAALVVEEISWLFTNVT